MRARLGRSHRPAAATVERVLEAERLDAQLIRSEPLENPLGVVRAVVAPHARVVAADDEVGAAVVPAHQRVEDRFARPRVPHGGWKRGEEYTVARVIPLEQDPVAPDAD